MNPFRAVLYERAIGRAAVGRSNAATPHTRLYFTPFSTVAL